jgi:hypothetical protein
MVSLLSLDASWVACSWLEINEPFGLAKNSLDLSSSAQQSRFLQLELDACLHSRA